MFTISLAAFHALLFFSYLFVCSFTSFLVGVWQKKTSGLCVSENVCIYYFFVSVREWSLATTTATRESEIYISKVFSS